MLSFTPFPTLETENLILRRITSADRDDLFAMRADPLMHRYTDTTPDASVEETDAYIEKMRLGVDEDRWIIWAMEHRASHQVIGSISIWNIDEQQETGDLGYGIIPGYQGKGLMKEALTRVISYGFRTMCLKALEAYTEEGNIPSRKLLEGCRFQEVNRVDDPSSDGTRVYHMIVYRLGGI